MPACQGLCVFETTPDGAAPLGHVHNATTTPQIPYTMGMHLLT